MADGPSQVVDVPLPDKPPVVLRRRKPVTHAHRRAALNGLNYNSRPKSEFFSPNGVSTLDIRTRLRIAEAELAIVQREVSDLLAERNSHESSARQWEESWKFAVNTCGRIVEQRDELKRMLQKMEATMMYYQQLPEAPKQTKKGKVTRHDLDQCKQALETQTRVCETLEHERDRANDDYEFAQAQLHTVLQLYQELASTCSEVARERDKAKAQVQLLRDELHRYDPDNDTASEAKKSNDSLQSGDSDGGAADGPQSEQALAQLVKELRRDRDTLQRAYEQAALKADQYKKQLYRAEEDRRQALATSEALTALWHKKFEKAQLENYDLRQELLSAHERISLLQDRLALERIHTRNPPPPSRSASSHDMDAMSRPPHRSNSLHAAMNHSTVMASGYLHPSLSQGNVHTLPHPLTAPVSMSQSSTLPNLTGLPSQAIDDHRGSLTSPHDLISPSNPASSSYSQPVQATPTSQAGSMWTRRHYMFDDLGNHSPESEEGSWI